jgi:hypothetical protein
MGKMVNNIYVTILIKQIIKAVNIDGYFDILVFDVTFSNISAISWRPV